MWLSRALHKIIYSRKICILHHLSTYVWQHCKASLAHIQYYNFITIANLWHITKSPTFLGIQSSEIIKFMNNKLCNVGVSCLLLPFPKKNCLNFFLFRTHQRNESFKSIFCIGFSEINLLFFYFKSFVFNNFITTTTAKTKETNTMDVKYFLNFFAWHKKNAPFLWSINSFWKILEYINKSFNSLLVFYAPSKLC